MFNFYLERWTVVQKTVFFACCWLTYGVLHHAINRLTTRIDWLESLVFLTVFALVTHGVFALLNWLLPSRQYGRVVGALLAFYTLVWFVANKLFNWINPQLSFPMNGGNPISLTHPGYLKHIAAIVTNFSVIALAFYHAQRSVKHLMAMQKETAEKLEETERRLQAELEKQQYEYRALTSQISPHLYASVILSWHGKARDEHPQLAGSMEDMYKLAVYDMEAREPGKEVIPLQREIDNMLLYLKVMNTLDTPVFVNHELTAHTAGYTVPPTTLIEFASNAIKHGVHTDPTRPICIQLTIANHVLRFLCRNRIKDVSSGESHGVGLANVRRRLDIQYEDAYTLEAYRDGQEFVVELTINY